MMVAEIKGVPDIFKSKTPSLARMKKEKGEEYTLKYLQMWIVTINDLSGVDKQMNEIQVQYTSKLVFQENPLLTVADIKLVCDRILSGHYGELYNMINSVKICKCFKEYWDERLEIGEQQSYIEHQENIKKESNTERMSEKGINEIKEAVKKFKATK